MKTRFNTSNSTPPPLFFFPFPGQFCIYHDEATMFGKGRKNKQSRMYVFVHFIAPF